MSDFILNVGYMAAYGLGAGAGIALGAAWVLYKLGWVVRPGPEPSPKNDPLKIVRRPPPEPKNPIPRDRV